MKQLIEHLVRECTNADVKIGDAYYLRDQVDEERNVFLDNLRLSLSDLEAELDDLEEEHRDRVEEGHPAGTLVDEIQLLTERVTEARKQLAEAEAFTL